MIKLKTLLMEDYTESSVSPFVDFTQDLVDLRNLYYKLETESEPVNEDGGLLNIMGYMNAAASQRRADYDSAIATRNKRYGKSTKSKTDKSPTQYSPSREIIDSLDSAIQDHVQLIQKPGLPGIFAIMSVDSSDFSGGVGSNVKKFFSNLFGTNKEKPFFDVSMLGKDLDEIVKRVEELRQESQKIHDQIKSLKVELESLVKSRTKISNDRKTKVRDEIDSISLELGKLTRKIVDTISKYSNKMAKIAGQGRSEQDYNAIRLMIRGEILKRLK